MPHSVKKSREIAKTVNNVGIDLAAEHFGITRESVRRAMRICKAAVRPEKEPVDQPTILKQLTDRYTEKELRALAVGAMQQVDYTRPIHDFRGETIRIGYMTDMHLGSIYTNPAYIRMAYDEFSRGTGVDFVAISGDVTEGMSHRAGHVYECSHIGYAGQKEHAIEVLSPWKESPIYMIDGNHDRWFIKSAGAHIVKDICESIPNAEFIGHDEGDIVLNDNATLKLWHGEDGSSYAISYRLQKLIESFTGGEKPSVLFAGHVHKQGYFFVRHVHCISGGAIQSQSKWMRAKRLASHTGFHIVELKLNEKGVASCRVEWFPFYV